MVEVLTPVMLSGHADELIVAVEYLSSIEPSSTAVATSSFTDDEVRLLALDT